MRSIIAATMFLTVAWVSPAHGQQTLDFPVGETQPYHRNSGEKNNPTNSAVSVYQETIQVPGASWIRVYFGESELQPGSFIRITSPLDGEVQELDAPSLAMWDNSSAYFNGDAVVVELIAGPNTNRNQLVVDEVTFQTGVALPVESCGICGADDRVPSDEDWACRLLPAGCSAAIWHPESCVVSAGHCMGDSMVIQFKVPESSPNCGLNHPPVAEQFPIIEDDFSNGGVGDDWAVMRAGTNNIGQLPYERYGQLRPIAFGPPATDDLLNIWGYGIDSECTRSQTQQTDAGSVTSVSSTFFNHDVDATFGNSGSSIIRSAEVLGIATHCPCPNYATRVDHPDFAEARELMCPDPELGTTTVPLFDTFPLIGLNRELWTGIDGAATSSDGNNEPTPQRSLNLNGSYAGGEAIRTAIMDTSDVTELVVDYWYEAGGTADAPEVGDDLIVEYLNSSETWVEINLHFGTGESMADYEFVSISLPSAAQHPGFRVQLRCTSDEQPPTTDDDWFVDNLCIGSAEFCAEPFECVGDGDCDDNLPCTVDQCLGGLCSYTPDDALCDDGLFCNGVEECEGGICRDGRYPCPGQTCDEDMDECGPATCNFDGYCDLNENCNSCPDDCVGNDGSQTCGDGICQPSTGEDCVSCASDCRGRQNGKPSRRYCCGADVDCTDERCNEDPWVCDDVPFCCGDGACDAGENQCDCPVDCGTAPFMESDCTDGVDNDCDGLTDGADSDCCGQRGDPCSFNDDCCSGSCKHNNKWPFLGTCR